MSKADVLRSSPLDMIAYLTDCTLATIADMSMKKRVPKCEYERQKGIAQRGMDFLRHSGWNPEGRTYKSRPFDVMQKHGWSVEKYAEEIRSKWVV